MTYDQWKTRDLNGPERVCEACGEYLKRDPEGKWFCPRCEEEIAKLQTFDGEGPQ